MTTTEQRKDPILAWGSLAVVVVGAVVMHEFGWRWYLVLGFVASYVALLAWRRRTRAAK